MLDFDAIDDTLIIGSAFTAADVPLLVELRVGAVVSLQAEAPDPIEALERAGIVAARVGCEDFRAPSLGQLEQAVDTLDDETTDLPTGDQLAEELQQFLREQGPDEP